MNYCIRYPIRHAVGTREFVYWQKALTALGANRQTRVLKHPNLFEYAAKRLAGFIGQFVCLEEAKACASFVEFEKEHDFFFKFRRRTQLSAAKADDRLTSIFSKVYALTETFDKMEVGHRNEVTRNTFIAGMGISHQFPPALLHFRPDLAL